jgi:phenylalanyl-tRNA synthetase beta chain
MAELALTLRSFASRCLYLAAGTALRSLRMTKHMNILVSYNWIKEHLDTDLSPEEFARKTTAAGNSVERMDRVGDRFEKMVVGFVKKVKAHPNADKLKIAETDIGKKTVEIVCGGENLAEGQRVVVGLPGARVKWHGEGELVELEETKIRGVESFGMICAVEEIGFDKLSTGKKEIWDITTLTDAKPGTPVAKALELDDVVFDIEVTSNRPDCKSIIGQAREGAVVVGRGLKEPIGSRGHRGPKGQTGSTFEIEVKEQELCPKYSAIVIENVKVGPSPWWLQKKLLLAGHRPINNVVDITNYILLEYGQPLHAFDADKLHGGKIIVRKAKKNEKFLALDGKEYTLGSEMLVIADAKKAVAVAGVMGGEETGTTLQTKRVLIESATFDPVSVRRTARALTLYSDSQLLFEKGLSTQATEPALERVIELIVEIAGGTVVSPAIVHETKPYEPIAFSFDPKAANRLMGIELAENEMIGILERLGFEVKKNTVTIPYWRDHDIENSVDFVEEIARVYGYANFPSVLPSGELPLVFENPSLYWQRRVKDILLGAGLTEVYSYAFLSAQQLKAFGIDKKQAVTLRNPLSSDFEFMRPSLIPSMLSVIEQNQSQQNSAALFELAPVYHPQKNDLPEQPFELVIALYGSDGASLYFELKGIIERFLRQSGIRNATCQHAERNVEQWHPTRSAVFIARKKFIATFGQISESLADRFKIDVPVVLARIDFEALIPHLNQSKSFIPLPTFPVVKRDLAFVIQERTTFEQIEHELRKTSKLLETVELFDVFRGENVGDGMKSMAVHLTFRHPERTLESKEVEIELETIRIALQKEFGAVLRS